MVHDLDVRLWKIGNFPQAGFTPANFPWGPRNLAVPGGNGLPAFPDGEKYLTMEAPPIQWIIAFNAQPTGYALLGNRLNVLAAPSEVGINYAAWSLTGGGYPIQIQQGYVNMYWTRETCEARFSTNLLQLLEEDLGGVLFFTQVFIGDLDGDFKADACKYTEFVLPDRSNYPVSALDDRYLDTGKQDLTPAGLYDLLYGDYLITTHLLLDTVPGGGAVLPVSGSRDSFDTLDETGGPPGVPGQDCRISLTELFNAVAAWLGGQISTTRLFVTVGNWFKSSISGSYC
jgi:hypothetical protein